MPENSKRTSEMKDVSHDSIFALTFENMLVMDRFECTFYLFVDKVKRSFKSCDFRGELLPDTKMSGFPGHRLSRFDQPGCPACNRFFIGVRYRYRMQVNTS